jgi:hypothetical protein
MELYNYESQNVYRCLICHLVVVKKFRPRELKEEEKNCKIPVPLKLRIRILERWREKTCTATISDCYVLSGEQWNIMLLLYQS